MTIFKRLRDVGVETYWAYGMTDGYGNSTVIGVEFKCDNGNQITIGFNKAMTMDEAYESSTGYKVSKLIFDTVNNNKRKSSQS